MARPKDNVYANASAAFIDKCEKENNRLKQKLSQQLRFDLHSLQEDDSHSDFRLVIPNDVVNLHTAILKSRCPKFYFDFLEAPAPGSSKNLDFANTSQLKDVIKAIYTSDDLSSVNLLVEKWLNKRKRSTNSFSGDLSLQLENKTPDPNDNVSMGTGADGIFSPDVDIVLNDFYDPSQTSSGLMTPFDPNLDFEAGLKSSNGTATSDENKENEDIGPKITGCCRLADDLLSLLKKSINSDVTIVVGEQEFKAHKCILCARSTYFAAMLSGSWMESESQVIRLEGISPSTIEKMLFCIYGATSIDLQDCRLTELVAVSDMYSIASVKDIASYVIKMDYCHFFHKPCTGCIATVPETMPLAYTYGLTDVLERCYKWNARHFVRLWPTKNFAILPADILTECCKAVVDELTCDNVINTALDYERLKGSLPHGRVRWAEPITKLATKLIDACVDFLKNRIVEVVSTAKFVEFGTTNALGLNLVEDVFSRAVHDMPPEKAPGTYCKLIQLDDWAKIQPDPVNLSIVGCTWTEEFKSMIGRLRDKCGQYMNLHIQQLVITEAWKKLPVEMQNSLKEGAFYVDVKHVKKKDPPKRRDYKISQYGRVQKPKQQAKGAGVSGAKSGPTTRGSKTKPSGGDDGPEGATVLPAEHQVGEVDGAVGGAAMEAATVSGSNASHSTTKASQRSSGTGHNSKGIKKSETSSTRQSKPVAAVKSTSQMKSNQKMPTSRAPPPSRFQSQPSSSSRPSSSNLNSSTRKSHALTHKDEPKEKKAKTSTDEKERRKSSKLPIIQKAASNSHKSGIPKLGSKQNVNIDTELNIAPKDDTPKNKSPPGAGAKQLDLRKKLMLNRSDSDHKLLDCDSVSLCSNMAVRGSRCNSNDDLSPSDFGSDCFSETSSQHDLDAPPSAPTRFHDPQSLAGDDGYSSNRTNPDDYSPQIEQLLAAVDAVHFEPEPLISTLDVIFEPPDQDNQQ